MSCQCMHQNYGIQASEFLGFILIYVIADMPISTRVYPPPFSILDHVNLCNHRHEWLLGNVSLWDRLTLSKLANSSNVLTLATNKTFVICWFCEESPWFLFFWFGLPLLWCLCNFLYFFYLSQLSILRKWNLHKLLFAKTKFTIVVECPFPSCIISAS